MKNQKNITINNSELGQRKALSDFKRTISTMQKQQANTSSNKFDEVRLRLGKIDNYLINRNGEPIDPLDTDKIINMSNGKVVIQWLSHKGGVLRPTEYGYPSTGFTEDWKYNPIYDSKYPEDRTLNCYNHENASAREIIDLTQAFIWNNTSNWCGMHCLPPVGSIVICGFGENNRVFILGYLQDETGYKVSKPYIKPGETIIKGYGNNYIHWTQSSRLDIYVKAEKDKKDLADPYKNDRYESNIDMWQRFNGYTKTITTSVECLDDSTKSMIEISNDSINLTSMSEKSTGYISLSSIDALIKTYDSKLFLNKNNSTIQYGSNYIKINSKNVECNTNINTSKDIKANRVETSEIKIGNSVLNDELIKNLYNEINMLKNEIEKLR